MASHEVFSRQEMDIILGIFRGLRNIDDEYDYELVERRYVYLCDRDDCESANPGVMKTYETLMYEYLVRTAACPIEPIEI